MPGELPYVLTNGAIHQVTRTLADELAERGITVNAVNPGPVDTGWPSEESREKLTQRFPAGRWANPAISSRYSPGSFPPTAPGSPVR